MLRAEILDRLQEQLRRGLRATYFDSTPESLEQTETLDALFDMAEMKEKRAQG